MPTATILRERPVDSIPEVQFDARGNCLWVLFEDDDYVPWCGIFGAGELNIEGRVLAIGEEFLVFVAGRLYRVNGNTRTLVFASEERGLTDFIYMPQFGLAVAGDYSRVHCYGPEGPVWRSKPLSPTANAVVLERCEGSRIHGFFFEDVLDLEDVLDRPFILHLDSMHIEFEPSVEPSFELKNAIAEAEAGTIVRHFFESQALPELKRTVLHAEKLPGLVVVSQHSIGGRDLNTIWSMQCTYRGSTFFIETNDHAGLTEFFVTDPQCPDDVMLAVLRHFHTLSPLIDVGSEQPAPWVKPTPLWLLLLIATVLACLIVAVLMFPK